MQHKCWLNLGATQVLGRQNHAPHAVRGDSGTQHAKQSCMTGGLRQQTVAGAAKNAIPGAKTKGKKSWSSRKQCQPRPGRGGAGRAPNPKQFRGQHSCIATCIPRRRHSAQPAAAQQRPFPLFTALRRPHAAALTAASTQRLYPLTWPSEIPPGSPWGPGKGAPTTRARYLAAR